MGAAEVESLPGVVEEAGEVGAAGSRERRRPTRSRRRHPETAELVTTAVAQELELEEELEEEEEELGRAPFPTRRAATPREGARAASVSRRSATED